MTMLSRILGLVRDVVLLGVFGAGGLMDAFWSPSKSQTSYDDCLQKVRLAKLSCRYCPNTKKSTACNKCRFWSVEPRVHYC